MNTLNWLHNLRKVLEKVLGVLNTATLLSTEKSHAWLKEEIRETQSKLTEQTSNLGVLGEFKRGKSTLLNALTETDFIPTD